MSAQVAVVIPCYNYGKYVEEAVESSLASTYENIEIIVVDDGSTDEDTIRILNILENKPKTRVIKRENGGLSAARNTGIQATNAKYILLLDADDLINPTFIEKGVWLLEKYPSYSYAYSLVKLFGNQNKVWNTLPFDFFYLKFRNFIPATIIIRRTSWEQTGGYDETMRDGYEDWEFLLRMAKLNMVGIHLNEILFFYRKHYGSMLENSNKRKKLLLQQIYIRHSDLYKLRAMQFFVFLLKEAIRRTKLYSLRKCSHFSKKIPVKIKEIIKKIQTNKRHPHIRLNKKVEYILPKRKEKKKKRVLIILPWLQVGGVERVFLNITKNLHGEFDFIIVTTLSLLEHPWEEAFLPYTKAVYHIGSFVNNDDDKLHFLLEIINSWSIDVVHLSNSQFGYKILPFIKAEFSSVKVIDTLHMEEPWAAWDYFRLSRKYKENIDIRVTLTPSQKERLYQLGEDKTKINIIPNGIDIFNAKNKLSLTNERHRFTISFIGRLVAQKQPILFLELARECKRKNLPYIFRIFGEGELSPTVNKYISRWKLDNVKINGFAHDIYSALQETSVLCIPSLREGLPMIGLEAMSVGVPIVATKVPGWEDLIKDGVTGLLSEANAVSLMEKCNLLYKDPNLYTQIAQQAKQNVSNDYTVMGMAQAYARLYE